MIWSYKLFSNGSVKPLWRWTSDLTILYARLISRYSVECRRFWLPDSGAAVNCELDVDSRAAIVSVSVHPETQSAFIIGGAALSISVLQKE